MQNTVAQHQLGTAVGAMAFTRGLLSTFIVAIFGVIVLHALPEATGADAKAALQNMGDMAAAAGAFRMLFLVGAACLTISLFSLLFMEERPLETKRPG